MRGCKGREGVLVLGSHLLHVHVFALALRSLDGEDEEGVEHGERAERDEAHDEEVEPAEVDLVVNRVLRQLRLVHTQARHVGDGVLQLYDTHTAQRFIQLYDTHSTAVYSAVRHTQHSGLPPAPTPPRIVLSRKLCP